MKPKVALVLGDVHFPYEHKKAIAAVKKLVHNSRFHTIVQIGDLLDLYGLSRFAKEPGRGLSLKAEAQLGRDFICEMQDSCAYYLQVVGNHDLRLAKRLQETPELASTHPTLRELLGVPESNWVPYHTHRYIGKVAYTHDLGHCGAHAAKQTLDAMQSNVVFGHTHRGSLVYGGDVRGDKHVAMNVGWLGDADACDYLPEGKKKDWQIAVGTVDYSHSGLAYMQLHPFINGKFLGL